MVFLILCDVLVKENEEAFVEIANPDKISAFGLEDETHKYSENGLYAKVINNVYVRQFMSSANILETVSNIADSYDKVVGTDYLGNILFSLKWEHGLWSPKKKIEFVTFLRQAVNWLSAFLVLLEEASKNVDLFLEWSYDNKKSKFNRQFLERGKGNEERVHGGDAGPVWGAWNHRSQ